MYEQLKKLKSNNIRTPVKDLTKDMNKHFSKNVIQIANMHIKIFRITSHQRNGNKNPGEILLHCIRMSLIQTLKK